MKNTSARKNSQAALCLLLSVLAIGLLSACKPSAGGTSSVPSTSSQAHSMPASIAPQSQKEEPLVQAKARFVQLGIPEPLPDWPVCYSIQSLEQLRQFTADNAEQMGLEMSFGDSTFAETVAQYDEAYFQSRGLVLVFFGEGDGSTTHALAGVEAGEHSLSILISRNQPEVVITVLAQWAAIIELDAQYLELQPEVQFV